MELPIRYVSTRGGGAPVSLRRAVERGLAGDAGLYVPERLPSIHPSAFDGAEVVAEVAEVLLRPFLAGDPLEPVLAEICRESFGFPMPLRELGESTSVLELFHGPTAAFKDVGARFLAGYLTRLDAPGGRLRTVLVATSGDTGGAVAAAFHGRPRTEVVVLYPRGMVSPRQEQQLAGWGDNVRALAVRGSFDDCQRVVKLALGAPDAFPGRHLCSANSINVARLLPQMAYHAAASLWYLRRHGREPGLVVPSGNLGNAVAALWAQRIGLPIREVVLATNGNRAVSDFFAGGPWRPAPTVPTLATAMDVGDPSNMERLLHLFRGEQHARRAIRCWSVGDEEIRETIRETTAALGEILDPHTAVAVATRRRLETPHWIVVSTAHPAKFEGTVEPLVGRRIPLPSALAALLERPCGASPLDPTLAALRAELQAEDDVHRSASSSP
jgi:threonine synthase